MNKKYYLLLLSCILLGACVEPKTHELHSTFDVSKAQIILEKGNNTIKGEAFIRQQSGNIVTCAGYDVDLIPYTEYTDERMTILYGAAQKGFNRENTNVKFTPDILDYYNYQRTKTCRHNSSFTFDNVKDGNYYIVSCIYWWVNNLPQGGCLMENVSVTAGETIEVILSP